MVRDTNAFIQYKLISLFPYVGEISLSRNIRSRVSIYGRSVVFGISEKSLH